MIQSSFNTGNTSSFCRPQILYDLVDLTNGNGMKFNCTKSNTLSLITITSAVRSDSCHLELAISKVVICQRWMIRICVVMCTVLGV